MQINIEERKKVPSNGYGALSLLRARKHAFEGRFERSRATSRRVYIRHPVGIKGKLVTRKLYSNEVCYIFEGARLITTELRKEDETLGVRTATAARITPSPQAPSPPQPVARLFCFVSRRRGRREKKRIDTSLCRQGDRNFRDMREKLVTLASYRGRKLCLKLFITLISRRLLQHRRRVRMTETLFATTVNLYIYISTGCVYVRTCVTHARVRSIHLVIFLSSTTDIIFLQREKVRVRNINN